MKRELTCIVCPMGCNITVEIENGAVKSVSGNTCRRGEEYAKNECTNPKRTVTSTVRCSNGRVVSVKTDKTIPKENMKDCIKIINNKVAPLPISIGDVIIDNVFGANIVATSNMN